jgi:transcriptional regulator with PAS, ATPase and Fis domain
MLFVSAGIAGKHAETTPSLQAERGKSVKASPLVQSLCDRGDVASNTLAASAIRERRQRLEARIQSICASTDCCEADAVRALGQSESWREVVRKALRVAATDTTVLLEGESGTGKEVIARFIHQMSSRRRGPFVAVNCAAVPDSLLESELFGYERGAFTGAERSRPGYLEQAGGGVLFLDEVSELTAAGQAKLLRVLEDRQVQHLGGTHTVKISVRVIAATNKCLARAVERGAFREDLFYRLGVFDIWMPPLRERSDDILELAGAFIDDLRKTIIPAPGSLTPAASETLLAYDWPGNIRQLRNVLERAAILCDGGAILQQHLCLPPDTRRHPESRFNLGAIERRTIEDVLIQTGWNKSKAAAQLGLTRTQLYSRLRKYDLNKPVLFPR